VCVCVCVIGVREGRGEGYRNRATKDREYTTSQVHYNTYMHN
jgi:hypothetical protein